MERWGPFAKIGPPLRPAGGPDGAALWQGSAQGHIACVASDHSPRPPAQKEPGRQNIFLGPDESRLEFRRLLARRLKERSIPARGVARAAAPGLESIAYKRRRETPVTLFAVVRRA